LLLEKQSCIGCDFVAEVGLAQSTVAGHLRGLEAASVIVGEIERPRVCYSLDPASLLPLAKLLQAVIESDRSIRRPPRKAETMTPVEHEAPPG